MGKDRVGSPRPRQGCTAFVDGRGGLVNGVLFLVLFDEFMRNLPDLPVLEAEDVDPLRLQKAGEGVLFSLYREVGVFADHYDVPVDLLWGLVVDWVVSDHMGTERTPVEFLVLEKEEPERPVVRSGTDVVPICPSAPLTEAQWELALEETLDSRARNGLSEQGVGEQPMSLQKDLLRIETKADQCGPCDVKHRKSIRNPVPEVRGPSCGTIIVTKNNTTGPHHADCLKKFSPEAGH